MNINTNINLATREGLKNTEDKFGQIIRTIFILGVIIFPWVVSPNFAKATELPREVFLFFFSGLFFVLYFFYSLKKSEFEWRRTKLNWILAVWAVLFGLSFLYSKNYRVAWEGYPGSFTGGLSEHLVFFAFYLLATQLFLESEWKKIIQYFLSSITAVLGFFILAAVYFQNNNLLTVDFARTPSLVAAASGVGALALWWVLKRTETVKKGHTFVLVLALFFISSLLDFHLSWWMWVGGVAIVLLLDLIGRIEIYKKEKETRTLGVNKNNGSLVSLLFHGDSKYLFLIILFALSRSLSPLFLGEHKLILMPYSAFLTEYPLFGQKVIFYLSINLIVFCFGLYYYWRVKKERNAVILVLSGLVSISLGHILYYSESTIFSFLNWMLLVYAGLTFLRKAPEKDYLYFLKAKSQGRKVFFVLGTIFSIIILGFTILRVASLF